MTKLSDKKVVILDYHYHYHHQQQHQHQHQHHHYHRNRYHYHIVEFKVFAIGLKFDTSLAVGLRSPTQIMAPEVNLIFR